MARDPGGVRRDATPKAAAKPKPKTARKKRNRLDIDLESIGLGDAIKIGNDKSKLDAGIKSYGDSHIGSDGRDKRTKKKVLPSAKEIRAREEGLKTGRERGRAQERKDREQEERYKTSPRLAGRERAKQMTAGIPGGALARFGINFGYEATEGFRGLYNLPVQAYRDPKGTAVDLVKGSWENIKRPYGHIVHGRLDQLANDLYEMPISTVTGILAPASVTTRAGVKAGVVPKPSETRRVYIDSEARKRGGSEFVEMPASRNPLGAHIQHGIDRLSEQEFINRTPVLGSKSRVRRELAYEREVHSDVLATRQQAFNRATSRRKLRRPGDKTAYEAVARYGASAGDALDGSVDDVFARTREFVQREIEMREKRLANEKLDVQERINQRGRVTQLKQALKRLEDPSDELITAIDEGRRLTEKIEAKKIADGTLKAETAAKHKDFHARVVSGASFFNTKEAAKRMREVTREIDRVDRKIERAEKGLARAAAGAPVRRAQKALDKNTRQAALASMRQNKLRESYERAQKLREMITREETYLANALASGRIGKAERMQERLERLYGDLHRTADDAQRYLENGRRKLEAQERAAKNADVEMQALVAQRELMQNYAAVIDDLTETSERLDGLAAAIEAKGGSLVGAEDVTAGEGAFHYPDVARPGTRSRFVPGGRSLREPDDRVRQNTGTLFTEGRARGGTAPTQLLADREQAIQQVREAIKEAQRFERDLPATGRPDPGYMLMNPDGYRVARSMREEGLLEELVRNGETDLAKLIDEDTRAILEAVLPEMEPKDVIRAKAQGKRLTQIPQEVAEALTGGSLIHLTRAIERNRFVAPFAAAWNALNNATILAYIYGKMFYIPVNFISDNLLLWLQQGPLAPINLGRAARATKNLPREVVDTIDAYVGAGAGKGLYIGRGPLGGVTSKTADLMNKVASQWTRRAAIIYELRHAGYKTPDEMIEFVDMVRRRDPEAVREMKLIGKRAEDAMINFRKVDPELRAALGRMVFVFGWLYASGRFTTQLPLNHPHIANMLAGYAQGAQIEEVEDEIGLMPSWLNSYAPIGEIEEKLGVRSAPMVNVGQVTPVGSFADITGAAVNAATGDVAGASSLSRFSNFPTQLALALATRTNPQTGNQYAGGKSAAEIATDVVAENIPALKLGKELADPTTRTRPYLGTLRDQDTFIPAETEGEARKDAVGKFLLGGLYPRDVNLDKANYKGREEKRRALSVVDRAVFDYHDEVRELRKEGEKLTPQDLEELQIGHALDYIERHARAEGEDAMGAKRLVALALVALGQEPLDAVNIDFAEVGFEPATQAEVDEAEALLDQFFERLEAAEKKAEKKSKK